VSHRWAELDRRSTPDNRDASQHVRDYAAQGVTSRMVRDWLTSRGIDCRLGVLPRAAYEGYVKAHGEQRDET